MMSKLTKPEIRWKKTLFSNKFLIFKNENEIGQLTQKWFSQDAEGRMGQNQLLFKSSNPFGQKVEIFDQYKRTVGLIKYNLWKTEADLTLNDKTYRCKMDGFFNFSLSINFNEETIYSFKGDTSKGVLEGSEIDKDMLLCGLYLMNYYVEVLVSFAIIIFLVVYL